MKYENFKFGNDTLVFWDAFKVELLDFELENKKIIRYFRKKGFGKWDKAAKIISRSGLANFREPFIIEPWNQILIDEANVYGTLIDENKEKALRGIITDQEVLKETKMSVAKIVKENLIWVARGQMVCHPDSLIYGEIDEIWYDKKTDTYIVGDTKTATSVDKMTYWYQLSIYIEILRALNPNKNISSVGVIDWVKIKKEKWVYNKNFDESLWQDWIGKVATINDPVYKARWNAKTPIPIEETNSLIKRDLERDQIIKQAKQDIELISQFKISSVDVFKDKLKKDPEFKESNSKLQSQYDFIKNKLK
ncbi:MAG: hypothetical protein HRS50_00205 [Mycoplasmataceae bacterium]|nr:hypothetical protein [Mycoplasmataceae bacterium]